MSWIVLTAVVGAVMVLVSRLTRKREEDTTAGIAAASPPDIGDTNAAGDADGDGGNGGE